MNDRRLQALLMPDDSLPAALCWRKVDARGKEVHDPDGALIRPGMTLRLDTFLNSFYERYWRDLTEIASLTLSVTSSGRCRIRVVRRSSHLHEVLVVEARSDGKRTTSVVAIQFADLPLTDAVLHLELEALDEPVVFHDGAWETETPPRNDIRLAVVTCSFGRESMLVENLRRLSEFISGNASIVEFLVVHQGALDLATFAPYATLLSDAALASKLRLVRQNNFGGTGGFVRGLLETLESPATHVLLLDDDIKITPCVIERLLALLAHLTAPATIGGQMLDLHEPTILRASHESVQLERLQLRNSYAGIDLAQTPAAVLFGKRQSSDYNAWWFCCIPTHTVREIGLPVPMFLRHDDVEYGIRTVAAGVPVVTMPGIFVWHEPFMKKGKALTAYYENRNFMITAALHKRVRRFHFVSMHWRNTWGALKAQRFEYCWALCRAVDDFLAGPASVFVDLPDRHRDLTAALARVTLMTMASVRYYSDAKRRRRVHWSLLVARLFVLGQRGLEPAEASFAATNRSLVLAIVRSSVALLCLAGRAEYAYRAEAATFTSTAYWRHLLGLPRKDP